MRQDNSSRVARGRPGDKDVSLGRGRIDWRHCTVLPVATLAELVKKDDQAAASEIDDTRREIMETVGRMSFDDKIPLYVASAGGQLLHVNEGYRTLANDCDFFRPPTDGKEDKARLPDGLMAILEEVCLTRRIVTIEEQLKVGNRICRYRSRHFPILSKDNQVIGVGGTYVDYTAQAEKQILAASNEQRLKDFARASSDWFWEADRELILTHLSDRLTAIVGMPGRLLLGKHLSGLGKLVASQGKTIVYDALERRVPFRDQFLEMGDKKGNKFLFHLSGVPVFNAENGEFEGYRGAGMDVTSRMRAEQEAADMRRSLENTLEELTNKNHQLDVASATAEHALATKSEFLAGMSHELRTPLNAIIGFAEAMKLQVFGELDPHYISYSEDIMNAGRHLLGLINDVLDVAVLENNKIKLDAEMVPLKEIVDAALSLVIMRANQKGQDTSAVKVDPQWEIYVDLRRAIQVLVNLLSNAVKFTPEKGRIGIDVTPLKGGNKLAVTVWDTGLGIQEEEQELVFEKFHQAKESVYSKREEGTGLGLHISRELASLMGGNLTLQSEFGKGSRFTATFLTAPPVKKSGK
jgi:PAS domain S-box-containing protein